MKLLYLTDIHARGDNPRARTDNYAEALRRKLAEVADLAREHGCTAILFGGDLTHSPDVAESVVASLIRSLRDMPCPIIGVSGNTHDVWGSNPDTVDRTALGIVKAAGFIRLLEPGNPIVFRQDEVSVQITGQPYHPEMDRRDWRLDYCTYLVNSKAAPEGHQHWRSPEVGWAIHIVHGMLRTKPLAPEVPTTLVQDVLVETSTDLTLAGHDHTGFGIIQHPSGRQQYVCNPGALMRLTAAREEIERPVQVALITLTPDEMTVDLIPLQSAAPGAEVLDRSHIDAKEDREAALEQFLTGVQAGGRFEGIDVPEIVRQVADRRGVAEAVRSEALHRVHEAQETVGLEEEVG